MKRVRLPWLFALAAAISLWGSPATALAQAQTFHLDIYQPLDTEVFVECLGESVRITGTDHIVVQETLRPNGRLRVVVNFTTLGGSAVGTTSGTVYDVSWPEHQTLEVVGPAPVDVSIVATTILRAHGPEPNARVRFRQHVTVNANGEVTVSRELVEATCQ